MHLVHLLNIDNIRYHRGMAKTRYVSANLTPDAAGALRDLCAVMTIETGRRVTTSSLVSVLAAWGDTHRAELSDALRQAKEGTS